MRRLSKGPSLIISALQSEHSTVMACIYELHRERWLTPRVEPATDRILSNPQDRIWKAHKDATFQTN